jgi:hypothetical protein
MKMKPPSKLSKFLYNPWTLAVGTVFLGIFLPSIINTIKTKMNIIASIQTILRTIFTAIKIFLCFRIPVWVVLLVVIGIICAIILLSKFSYDNESDQEPLWKNFTHFRWRNWLFTWKYSGNNIIDLRPICLKCQCELSLTKASGGGYHMIFYCPNCSSIYPGIYENDLEDIEKIIYHKLNTGEYKNEIATRKNGI